MIDPELYIKQGLKIVKTLMSQDNFQAARSACQELLKVNPYHRKVQKYLREIEEKIIKQNEEKVNADIKAVDHLWKEGRYDELLKIYTRLYQFAPKHAKLRGLIEKANEKLSSKQKNERADFLKRALAAIGGLMKEKHYGDTIQACNELLTVDPFNQDAANFLQKAKDALIEQKLKENERVVDSADSERSLEFLNSLLSIDPKNEKIKRLAEQAAAHLASQKMLASKIHLNESIVRMKDLFKHAEYEKVLQACEEIERLDPRNFSARLFHKKARQTIHAEIEDAMVKKLQTAWAELRPEYEKNQQGYVRI